MPESGSLAAVLAFGWRAQATFLDGDLVVNFGVGDMIDGPEGHYYWIFRRAASMQCSCSFHKTNKFENCSVRFGMRTFLNWIRGVVQVSKLRSVLEYSTKTPTTEIGPRSILR